MPVEEPDSGHDSVLATVDFVLGDNVEDLALAGDGVEARGNHLANRLGGTEASQGSSPAGSSGSSSH